jgi:hypothetical protein
VHKFLDGRILEVPLIVLQYYKKPSFLYIYIYKEKDFYLYNTIVINLFYKFNCENLLKFTAGVSGQR